MRVVDRRHLDGVLDASAAEAPYRSEHCLFRWAVKEDWTRGCFRGILCFRGFRSLGLSAASLISHLDTGLGCFQWLAALS